MADIYFSYSAEDIGLVKSLVAHLRELGYSIHWDTNFDIADEFSPEIKHQIQIASVVIVIWSENSINSRFVRAEAEIAEQEKKLVSIKIEELEAGRIPGSFSSHYINFREFEETGSTVTRRIGNSGSEQLAPSIGNTGVHRVGKPDGLFKKLQQAKEASVPGVSEVTKERELKDLFSKPSGQSQGANAADEEQKTHKTYTTREIFYGTDRKKTNSSKVHKKFGGRRGDFSYGVCTITLPTKGRKRGELPTPKWWKLQFSKDPAKFVTLQSIDEKDKNQFFGEMREKVSNAVDKQALVFIHGYNVTFEEAALRTGQLAEDLYFDGAPILYSWPSTGTIKGYIQDSDNVTRSASHLVEFIKDIVQKTSTQNLFLIAHSMGNRALTDALLELKRELSQEELSTIKEVVLTAPDIDAEIFLNKIAPSIVPKPPRITLYTSSKDQALIYSKKVHGYPRIGDFGDLIQVPDGIDTINASSVDTSLMGHSFYGDSKKVMSDMYHLLKNNLPPERRERLKSVESDIGKYWEFRTDE